jgi:hypothetical protein
LRDSGAPRGYREEDWFVGNASGQVTFAPNEPAHLVIRDVEILRKRERTNTFRHSFDLTLTSGEARGRVTVTYAAGGWNATQSATPLSRSACEGY